MSSRRVLLAPVLALVVATSACSGSGSGRAGDAAAIRPQGAAASSSIPDPCGLVAADQLSPFVGAAPVTSGPTEQSRGVTCHWEGEEGSSLDLTVWPGREFFRASPGATPVAGLGDEAESDGPLAHVMWRQGDITAQLVGLGLGDGGADKVVALARSVADRLPAS